jgi:hypothetical protein
MNKTPERPRKNFNAYDRPLEWYRLPFAIKLAVLNLWRAEQASDPSFERDPAEEDDATGSSREDGPRTALRSLDRGRLYYRGAMLKGVVVVLLIVAIGIGVYCLNTLAPVPTAPAVTP